MGQTEVKRAIKKLKVATIHEVNELLDANLYTTSKTIARLVKNNEICRVGPKTVGRGNQQKYKIAKN